MSDLRETIQAAIRGDTGVTPEPEPQPEPQAQAAPEPTPEPQPEPEANAGPERDENGRFKAKNTDAEPPEGAGEPAAAAPAPEEPAKPEEPEPQTEAIRIPPSLPAAVKAQWGDLKPEVQQAFAKLEESVQTAKAEWGRKGERLNRYDEILGPHLDRWRMNGLDEYQGVQSLLAAQQLLDANPLNGIVQIARSYGYTPQHLAQALGGSVQTSAPHPGQEGQPTPTFAPDLQAALAPVLSEVQTLKQHLESERSTSAQRTVEEFASRPENKYFENVREDVAILLETGRATTLQEAYEHACWMNPEVRAARLAEQSREQQRAAQAAEAERKARDEAKARAKAQTATAAAGSVTGSPTPGLAPAQGRSSGNLREDLLAAKQELSQQV